MSAHKYKQGPYEECWVYTSEIVNDTARPLVADIKNMTTIPGDPDWHNAHRELRELHVEKSSTYGTGADPLANFTTIAATANQDPERYVLERIVEKCARAIHMIDAGNAADVKEYPDIASLGLCAEALRRRRD